MNDRVHRNGGIEEAPKKPRPLQQVWLASRHTKLPTMSTGSYVMLQCGSLTRYIQDITAVVAPLAKRAARAVIFGSVDGFLPREGCR